MSIDKCLEDVEKGRMSHIKIVASVVHLKDLKGWERLEYYEGNVETRTWFVRRRMTDREIVLQISKFEQPDHPKSDSITFKNYKFELCDERIEPIDDKCLEYIKHVYFEEISCSHFSPSS